MEFDSARGLEVLHQEETALCQQRRTQLMNVCSATLNRVPSTVFLQTGQRKGPHISLHFSACSAASQGNTISRQPRFAHSHGRTSARSCPSSRRLRTNPPSARSIGLDQPNHEPRAFSARGLHARKAREPAILRLDANMLFARAADVMRAAHADVDLSAQRLVAYAAGCTKSGTSCQQEQPENDHAPRSCLGTLT